MSSRLERLEPLLKFLDTHEVRIEDLLVCICLHLEDYQENKFEHELECKNSLWKYTFKKGKDLSYPFKVL